MKKTFVFSALFAVSACLARAQVMPEATGPAATPGDQKLQYALRYAETGQFSSTLSNGQTSTVSGSLFFGNENKRLPFLVDYTGGYTWTLTGPEYGSGQFHRMFISQGIDSPRWKLLLSDDFSYLPQAPTTGFSGIPGTGEPIGGTSPVSPSNSQSILTVNTHALYNTSTGNLEHAFSPTTGLTLGSSYSILDFPNNDGLDTNTLMGTADFTKRFNSRNSLTAHYVFDQFTYPGYTFSFMTNAVLAGYHHDWTRHLSTDIAIGPQFINSSTTTVVPNSTNVTANAGVTYVVHFLTANAGYTRSVNDGAGYLVGGEVSSVYGGLSKQFGPTFTLGFTGGWEETTGLNTASTTSTTGFTSIGNANASYGGVEATYHLGRDLIFFANYTGTDQITSSTLPGNTLNNLLQVVGFGIGYSPRENRLRNQ